MAVDETRLYTHYKKVAIKHFNALKMMYNELIASSQNTSNQDHKSLLYDAFYISGYILEGASVYVIFRYIQWNPNVEIPIKKKLSYLLGINDNSNDYTNNYISNNTSFRFRAEIDANNQPIDGPLRQESNTFLRNLNNHSVFDYTKSEYTGETIVDFFSGTHSSLPQLLQKWDANKRYFLESDFDENRLTISLEDIEEIIEFCDETIIPYIKNR
ncbi:MAG: hypothetical protein J6T70_15740 [Bacteroidales bacterium]|nr:hypothetical protein [Bacteroidales bacterium]